MIAADFNEAADTAEALCAKAKYLLAERLAPAGKLEAAILEREQHAAHGLAWLATCAATLRQLAVYAERLERDDRLGDIENLSIRIAAGEYLNQIAGGIPMNQTEFARPADL